VWSSNGLDKNPLTEPALLFVTQTSGFHDPAHAESPIIDVEHRRRAR
jgi:hypothetical protein